MGVFLFKILLLDKNIQPCYFLVDCSLKLFKHGGDK